MLWYMPFHAFLVHSDQIEYVDTQTIYYYKYLVQKVCRMYVVAQRVSSRTYFKQISCVWRTNKSQGKLRNKSFIIVIKTQRRQDYHHVH